MHVSFIFLKFFNLSSSAILFSSAAFSSTILFSSAAFSFGSSNCLKINSLAILSAEVMSSIFSFFNACSKDFTCSIIKGAKSDVRLSFKFYSNSTIVSFASIFALSIF